MLVAEDPAIERAAMFKALGDPTRVRIFDFLRQRCCAVAIEESGEVRPVQGPSFGEVCCHVTGKDKVDTRMSFHLNVLKDAGLITVERRGRFMVCGVNEDAIATLAGYLAAPDATGCKEVCS